MCHRVTAVMCKKDVGMGYVRLVSCYVIIPAWCVLPSTHLVLMLFGTPIPTSLYISLKCCFILVLTIVREYIGNVMDNHLYVVMQYDVNHSLQSFHM